VHAGGVKLHDALRVGQAAVANTVVQGSSSTIFTPAITASSTSAPCVIIANAFCTAVMSPPFLKRLPFAEEMTMGLTSLWTRMFGNWSTDAFVPARVSPAKALVRTKSRRLIGLVMGLLK
jgi:hypothetical protein